MGDSGLRLRIKYKLRTAPSDAEAAEWAALAQQHIDRGGDPEDAGRRAADELFETRIDAPGGGPSGTGPDFPIDSPLSDRDILRAYIVSVSAITGHSPDASDA
ncbi:hypothetical protein ASF00_17660 [Sphingomonas sp. Leaf34]|nr:hypothetical protein ASF00_17660 [Sphingomonas sp. Leaf34]